MITLVCGIPAAGKSTWCGDKPVLSFDVWAIRRYDQWNANDAGQAYASDPHGRDAFLDAIAQAAAGCPDLCVEVMALTREERRAMVGGLTQRGCGEVSCVYVLCDLLSAVHRNQDRDIPVNRGILYKAWAMQEFPTKDEGFISVTFCVGAGR